MDKFEWVLAWFNIKVKEMSAVSLLNSRQTALQICSSTCLMLDEAVERPAWHFFRIVVAFEEVVEESGY